MNKEEASPVGKTISLYEQILTEGKEAKEAKSFVANLRKAKLQLKRDFVETQSQLDAAQSTYDASLRELPFSTKNILTAKVKVQSLTNGLNDIKELYLELFGEEFKESDL